MNRASHTPGPVRRVLRVPGISFAELLCPKLPDHAVEDCLVSHLIMEAGVSSFDYCADGKSSGVVGVVRRVIHQPQSALSIRVGLDEFEGAFERTARG